VVVVPGLALTGLARSLLHGLVGNHSWRQGASHLLELRACGHLLGVDRRLDPVEQPFEPPDQLGLRNA
jgi:hypothetical protein